MRAICAAALVLSSVSLLPSARGQEEARADYSIDGRTLTHRGFGFTVSVPEGWRIFAGPDAASRIGSAVAVFEREDAKARCFLEIVWNASIDASKYMEQLAETYAGGQDRTRGGAARAGALRGVEATYRFKTPDGTTAANVLVSVAAREWKYGFGFSCPEGALSARRGELDAILGSLSTSEPRTPPGWKGRIEMDSGRIIVALPASLWRAAGAFWPEEEDDRGTLLRLARDPYAAYAIYGAVEATGTTPEKETDRILAHVGEKNGTTRPARIARKAITISGRHGIESRYRHTATFPHQDYWVTVVTDGERLCWSVLWTLPDNAKALEREFETLSTGWSFER
ncbi:MAG: hypothetical protein HY720_00680 [Planctomycetes bacterium]|nr:hypothetical protein [Planctomycetota bacterium]